MLEELKGAAAAEGARLAFLSPWQVEAVLDLVQDAETEEAAAPDVQEEIARWTQADAGRTTTEGIPDYAFGPRNRHGWALCMEGAAAASATRAATLAVSSV